MPGQDLAFDVFLSYRHGGRSGTWVREVLAPRLRAAGLEVCLDVESFRLGFPLVPEMAQAVEQSRYTLAVMTPAYLQSGFTEVERVLAEHLGLTASRQRLLVVRRQACEPPPGLRVRLLLEMQDDAETERNMAQLLDVISPSPAVSRQHDRQGGVVTGTAVDDLREGRTQYDLFILYAEADKDWAHGFLMPELGLDSSSVVTPDDLTLGKPDVYEFERAVETARYTVLVLSPAFQDGDWSQFTELLASHASVRQHSDRLVPLLLHPCRLPLHLDYRVRLDCTERSRWEAEVARLRALLSRDPPAPERLSCPYPGLVPYGSHQADLFFGRQRAVDDICRRLPQQNLLLMLGPSGSGKSSLVYAGVLPRLTATTDSWLVRSVRPDSASLGSFLDSLGVTEELAATKDLGSGDQLREGVERLLSASPGAERLLLLVDQAEAIFLMPHRDEQHRFLSVLDRLRRVERCVVLLTLRADFYGELMTSALWPLGPGEQFHVSPLRGEHLSEAVTQPAGTLGVRLEPVLLERLLRDAGDEPAALPLVQETMVLLWERRSRRLLTVSSYEELGGDGRSGLAAALSTRSDAALSVLSDAQRRTAQRVLVRLVHLGEGRRDTRRRQSVSALRATGEDRALFDETLRHLIDRRLVTVDSDDGDEPTVDLGHEAMIEHWTTLQSWIDATRESELARRRIEHDGEEWQRNGRDSGELYRRRRLADAVDQARAPDVDLSDNARTFLVAGRRRRLLGRLGLAAAAAAGLGGVVWLAKPPVTEALLQRQAQGLSPVANLAAGPAIVGEANHRVMLPALAVDIHEVTNEQYRLCVRARRCAAPKEPWGNARFARGDRRFPVVFVTAYDAADFCRWLGRRLPTEDEWERAARGTDGRPYPWGGTAPREGQVNSSMERPSDDLVPVGFRGFDGGRSADGVEHLIGNAGEWTATQVRQKGSAVQREGTWDGRRQVSALAVKGGGWEDLAEQAAVVNPADAINADEELGFRCIRRAD